MRMRPVLSALAGILLGIITPSGFAQSSAPAAPSAKPPPPPPPSRAPIGAPPTANSDEINSAYEFRNRMSSDPACQELALKSDSVYMDPKLDGNEKKQALEGIRSRAKSAGCI